MKGKVILLNGVSSAGKTTLAKTLQGRLPDISYWLDVDTFIVMSAENPGEIDPRTYYPTGKDPMTLMHHTIKLFSDLGVNVIVDHGLFRPVMKGFKSLENCVELLHDYPLLFVHVTCPLEELRRREKERGDRHTGESERRLADFNSFDTYDITVNTFENTKEECADRIIELLDNPDSFKAFKTLWLQYKK